MKISDIKATVYDFFAYILPGLIFVFLGYIQYRHFQNYWDINENINIFCSFLDFKGSLMLLLLSYLLGHLLSSLSSLVVEKNIFLKINFLSKGLQDKNQISSKLFKCFSDKYIKVFNKDYESKDIRSVICYVESKQPAVYSTAFVFLSFYGMARSIAFSFSLFFISEMVNLLVKYSIWGLFYTGGALVVSLIFYYEYNRFFRYFRQEILSGFLLPE